MKNDWTERIKKMAEGQQRPLPDHIWEELVPHLPQAQKRRPVILFYFPRIFGTLLVLLIAGWWYFQNEPVLKEKEQTLNEVKTAVITGGQEQEHPDSRPYTSEQVKSKLEGQQKKSNGTLKFQTADQLVDHSEKEERPILERAKTEEKHIPASTEAETVSEINYPGKHFENILFLPVQMNLVACKKNAANPTFDPLVYKKSKNDCFDFKKNKRNSFTMDLYAGPSYSPYSLKDQRGDLNSYIQKRQSTEHADLGFLAGFRAAYHFSDYAIMAGLEYQQVYEQFNYRNPNETKIVTVYKDSVLLYTDTIKGERIVKTHNYHRLISVPFSFSYTFKWKSFDVSLQPGIGLNLSARHKGSILDLNDAPASFSSDDTNSRFNIYETQVGTFAFLNFQIAHPLHKKLDLFVEPGFIHYFKPFNKASYPVDQKYQSVQLKIGVRIKI